MIPIGGYLTMDRNDAVTAAGLLGADRYIPCHYGTMPALETDPQAFKTDVENAGQGEVLVLDPGESFELQPPTLGLHSSPARHRWARHRSQCQG